MKVFISHIAEEAALASVLKDWIESTFLGQVDVFVSGHDISSGEQWFRRLGEELTDAKAMLVLCSERSVSRPWINFEAGAGHVKDLAKHLGYARPPLIRHEEMTADLEKALSHLGQESGNNVVGDLGFVDHLVLFTEKTEALTSLISEFGDNTSEITIVMNKFSDQAEKAGNNPSSGTPRHVQRIAKKFGEDLSAYANNIEGLNRKYGEVLPEIKSSLQNVLTFKDLETTSGVDDVDEFPATLDETEQSVSGWKNSVVVANGTISELPNFQRDMNMGIRRVSEQFETLTSNLDDTLDMIQEARATYNSRLERRSLGQEP